MIQKFHSIKNQGKLNNAVLEPIEVKTVNIICGENGRGKSTFTDIFNALKTGEYETLRKKCDSADPSLEIEINDAKYIIQSEKELIDIKQQLNIHVFDREFIHSHVYSGQIHSKDHRSELFGLLIGKQSIDLLDELSSKKSKKTEITTPLNELEKSIKEKIKKINPDLTIESFTNQFHQTSENLQDLQASLANIETQIITQNTIKRRSALHKVQFNENLKLDQLKPIFQMTIENITQDASEKTQKHIQEFALEEKWLKTGIEKIKKETCPLCAQSLDSSALIQHFRSYFNENYTKIIQEIELKLNLLNNEITKEPISTKIEQNTNLLNEWKALAPDLTLEDVSQEVFNSYFQASRQLLQNKQKNPLSGIDCSTLEKLYEKTKGTLESYNKQIDLCNEKIHPFQLSQADSLRGEKINIQLKILFLEQKSNLDEFKKLKEQEQRVATELNNILDKIKSFTDKAIDDYGDSINQKLQEFHFDLEIDLTKKVQSNLSSGHLGIEVKKGGIALKFEHSLSEGDKNALAFAIWLCTIPNDHLDQHILVLDDPMTSLDEHRQGKTITSILDFGLRGGQIFIFTHLKNFAKNIDEKIRYSKIYKSIKSQSEHFRLIRSKDEFSIFEKWEAFEQDTKSKHLRTLDEIHEFVSGRITQPNLTDLKSKIRFILDEYINFKYFQHLTKSHQNPQSNFLSQKLKVNPMEKPFKQIQELYDYSNEEHHASQTDQINETELKDYLTSLIQIVNN